MPTIPVSNFLTVIVLWLRHFALSISGFCKKFVLRPLPSVLLQCLLHLVSSYQKILHPQASVARSRQICIYAVEALLVVIYLPKKQGRLYVHSAYLCCLPS
jgi:hypothetical protein